MAEQLSARLGRLPRPAAAAQDATGTTFRPAALSEFGRGLNRVAGEYLRGRGAALEARAAGADLGNIPTVSATPSFRYLAELGGETPTEGATPDLHRVLEATGQPSTEDVLRAAGSKLAARGEQVIAANPASPEVQAIERVPLASVRGLKARLNAKYLAGVAAPKALDLAAQTAAAALAPGEAASSAAFLEPVMAGAEGDAFARIRNELVKQGVPPDEAAAHAAKAAESIALSSGLLMEAPVSKVFGKEGGPLVRRALKSAGTFAAVNPATVASTAVQEAAATGDPGALKDLGQRAADSAVEGALTGAVMGAVAGGGAREESPAATSPAARLERRAEQRAEERRTSAQAPEPAEAPEPAPEPAAVLPAAAEASAPQTEAENRPRAPELEVKRNLFGEPEAPTVEQTALFGARELAPGEKAEAERVSARPMNAEEIAAQTRAAKAEGAAVTPADQQTEDLFRPEGSYDDVQRRIDAAEDELAAQGVDVVHLVDPESSEAATLLGAGWKPMPPDLAALYRQRDRIGAADDRSEVDAFLSRIPEGGPANREQIQAAVEDARDFARSYQRNGGTLDDRAVEQVASHLYTSLSHALAREGTLPEAFAGDLPGAIHEATHWENSPFGVSPAPLLRQVGEIMQAAFGVSDPRLNVPALPAPRAAPSTSSSSPSKEVEKQEVPPAGAGATYHKTRGIARALSDEKLLAKYRQTLRAGYAADARAAEFEGRGIRRKRDYADPNQPIGTVGTGAGAFQRGAQTQANQRQEAYRQEIERRGLEIPHPDDAFTDARPEDLPRELQNEFTGLRRLDEGALYERLGMAEESAAQAPNDPVAAVRRAMYAGEVRRRGLELAEIPAEDASGEALPFFDREPARGPNFTAASGGSPDYGRIDADVAAVIRQRAPDVQVKEGPIRLTHTRARHLWREHRRELERAGYASAEQFVEDVAGGYTQIRRGDAGSLVLVKPNGGAKVLYVELRPQAGGYWSVGSGHFKPVEELDQWPLLWESAPEDSAGSGPSGNLPPGSLTPDRAGGQTGIGKERAGPQQRPTDETIAESGPQGNENVREGGPEVFEDRTDWPAPRGAARLRRPTAPRASVRRLRDRGAERLSMRADGPPSGPTERRAARTDDGYTLKPVPTVELVRLANQLMGEGRVFTKKYPSARGAFYPNPAGPEIGLHPDLGKDTRQFGATLAHEIGHLVDYLPERMMQRGNILGRLASLRGYLAHTLDAVPSEPSNALTAKDRAAIRREAEKAVGPKPETGAADRESWQREVSSKYAELLEQEIASRGLLTRQAIHEELLNLSEWWRPFDRATAGASHIAYRESSPELYADALSVLLNSPGDLQRMAPTFFKSFLAYMERKPEVEAAYQGVQDLLAGSPEERGAERSAELRADFARGESIQRAADTKQAEPQTIGGYLKQLFVGKSTPAIDPERKRLGGRKLVRHSAQREVLHSLEELALADNVNHLLVETIEREVHGPMTEAGITREDAGEYLLLQRIAEGDRGGMQEQAREAIQDATGKDTWAEARAAYVEMGRQEGSDFDPALLSLAESGILNPHGYTPVEAKEQLAHLKRQLGPERYQALQGLMDHFRDLLFKSVQEGVEVGSINREVFETKIEPNQKTYAPYAVLDYFNGRMSAGVRTQTGTVKGVANPFVTAIMKTMTLNRLNEIQKAKTVVLRHLDEDFPGMAGPEQVIDKHHRERRPGPGRENLTYLVDGKTRYREVDAYVAKVFEHSDLGSTQRLARTLGSASYRVFHPLYVSFSLGWQVKNLPRDFKRTYKNLSSAHAGEPTYRQALESFLDVGRVTKAYVTGAPAAWARARKRYDPMIEQMLSERALQQPFTALIDTPEDTKYERLLVQYGIKEAEPAKTKAGRLAQRAGQRLSRSWLGKLGRALETVGVFQETLSKTAAYRLLGEQGITGQERAYITRNYVGTPNTTRRGLATNATNALFMYSNVVVQALRADAEVALQPATASGYWMRSVLMDFLPKAMMAAAVAGVWGDDLKEFYEKVPSYDKEKYIVLPLGTEDGKALYLRVPHDDTNRILAGATWALLEGAGPYEASHATGLVMGELPGLSPVISLPIQWAEAASGENPVDEFYGREVVPRDEWTAGGWPRAKEMLRYSLRQFGVASDAAGFVLRKSPDEGRSTATETVLRSVPGLSALVKASDRGLTEERYAELDREAQARARLRLDLPEGVREATRERSRLNRFGLGRLSDAEKSRRAALNAWYRSYRRLTDAMASARDRGDAAGYQRAKEQLAAATRALNENRGNSPPHLAGGGVVAPRPLVEPRSIRSLERPTVGAP